MEKLKPLNAKVSDRIELGPDLIILRVTPDGWKIPDFKAGQFITLGLPGSYIRSPKAEPELKLPKDPGTLIRRAYSIASSPFMKDFIEIYLSLVPQGSLTPRLWNLKVGDSLHMGSKMAGNFVMDDIPREAHVIFFATGTGLAPFMSMVRAHLKPDSKRHFSIFHGVRKSQDLGYRSELLALSNIFPGFSYFPIISRPQTDPIKWTGAVGHVQDAWKNPVIKKQLDFKPDPKNTHIFLCGAPQMIDDMTEILTEEGFTEQLGQIHVERYW